MKTAADLNAAVDHHDRALRDLAKARARWDEKAVTSERTRDLRLAAEQAMKDASAATTALRAAEAAHRDAQVDLASTKQGAADIQEMRAAYAKGGHLEQVVEMNALLDEGAARRERNTAVNKAARAAKAERVLKGLDTARGKVKEQYGESPEAVYRHKDGSISVIVRDSDPTNPRKDSTTFSTMVNMNSRTITIDSDPSVHTLAQLHDDDDAIRAAIKDADPDVVYAEPFHAGDSHGWQTVSKQQLRDAGFADDDHDAAARIAEGEASEYGSWAEGDVYGVVACDKEGKPTGEASWGYSGYGSLAEVAESAHGEIVAFDIGTY